MCSSSALPCSQKTDRGVYKSTDGEPRESIFSFVDENLEQSIIYDMETPQNYSSAILGASAKPMAGDFRDLEVDYKNNKYAGKTLRKKTMKTS